MKDVGKHLRNQWAGVLALFLVLTGGTAWAATELTKHSVRSGHIVNGQVKTQDLDRFAVKAVKLAPGAVWGPHIKDGAVTEEKLADGVAISGPQGPQGEPGEPGPETSFMSARINDVLAEDVSYGAVTGTSTANADEAQVETLTPDVPLRATSMNVETTGPVGPTGMNVYLMVNGDVTDLSCHVATPAGCSDGGEVTIPAGSRIAVAIANCCEPSPGALLVGLTLERG